MTRTGGDMYAVSQRSTYYPNCLKSLSKMPEKLYCFGNLFLLNSTKFNLGVVGTRKMTSYGEKALRYIFRFLSADEVVIISGFMYGVDHLAHKLALENGFDTVAVLGCGADVIYPTEQEKIYYEIKERGLIISEFHPGFEPKKWTFPKRNRIVAGLCDALLIVEAGIGSGALITGKFANEFNKPVIVVPGSIFESTYRGNHSILNDYADIYDSPEVLDMLIRNKKVKNLSESEKSILNVLKKQSMTIDELELTLDLNNKKISMHVSEMIIEGHLKNIGGVLSAC